MVDVSEPSITSPEAFRLHLSRRNNLPESEIRVPPGLVATFSKSTFDKIKKRVRGRYANWYYDNRLAIGRAKDVPVAVLHSYIGSPGSVMMLEELIAAGARSIVEVGFCGGITPETKAGDVVVVDRAFVDEGTSSRYFRAPREFQSSRSLTRTLESILDANRVPYIVGGVWTTDAPYRETPSKVAKFRGLGAVGVNMETSALFALGKYRHVDVASVQVVSDLLRESEWRASFHEKQVVARFDLSSRMAVETVTMTHSRTPGHTSARRD